MWPVSCERPHFISHFFIVFSSGITLRHLASHGQFPGQAAVRISLLSSVPCQSGPDGSCHGHRQAGVPAVATQWVLPWSLLGFPTDMADKCGGIKPSLAEVLADVRHTTAHGTTCRPPLGGLNPTGQRTEQMQNSEEKMHIYVYIHKETAEEGLF